MSNPTNPPAKSGASASVNVSPPVKSAPASGIPSDDASEKKKPITDTSGNVEGQTWEHNGFAIKAVAHDTELVFVVTELQSSQAANARQFRYTRTFVSLDAAQTAIDDIQAQHDFEPVGPIPGSAHGRSTGIKKPGATDGELKTSGWVQLANLAP